MFLGISLALIAALAHTGSFIFRKRGLASVDYKIFIAIRISVGLFIMASLLWLIGPGLSGLTFHKALPFVITGIIGNVFALMATTMAIHEIGASRTHALTSASPLVVAVLEVSFLGEQLTLKLLLGLLAIVLGAGLLSYRLHSDEASKQINRPLLGFGLATYTMIAVGVFTVLQKYGLQIGVTPLQGLFVRFLTGFTIYWIYFGLTRPSFKLKEFYRSKNYLLSSILLTGVALLSLFSMTYLSATLATGLKRVAPLFTVALAPITLRGLEKVDWQTFAISAIIVAGAILAIMG